MASSSSTPSSITTLTKKHEVFLSFRGEDTRFGFISHLYDALCRKNIETFIDDKLERGDEISPALLRAIEGSKIALVIFSENYASSKWCLRELTEIIKCMKLNKQIVMPVFYHVDPSDVRKLTGSFKCSFANKEKELQEEVQKWREALTETSNLSGWDSSVIRPDSKLVGEIVETVCRELRSKYIPSPSDFEGLIGIHKRIEHVKSLLCLDMKDVQKIIGIWGMGGVGKTTIARAVFKSISYQFDGACITEVGKILEEKGGSDRLICDVLSKVLHEEIPKLDTPICSFIMEMFNQKKVFIVLDDVNDFLQSESLVECLHRCGLGSRIIITSRDKQVLCNFNVDDHEIYEEEGLDDDEALELFHKYANPTKDCMELLEDIVDYAGGNPLVLKVLGSFLKGKSKQVWESAVDNLQGIVNSEIFDVLKISYDGLNEEEKKLFLDLACFYHDDAGTLQKELLDCEYSLSVLIDKSLVTIDMEMHNLLKEMGREIVRRESPKNPGKRSRLWERNDVIRTLKHNTGTDAVEGIYLYMGDLEDIHLISLLQMLQMHNLRFLLFNFGAFGSNKVHLPNGLNFFPDELTILHWRGYPLRVLPTNFNPKKLVKLDLSNSNIEQLWEGTKRAPKLKWLNLSYCPHLTKIPNLSDFPMLVKVGLTHCKSLVDFPFPSSVQQLNNLRNLDLSGTAIEEVPSSIQSLTNLTELNLWRCKRLKHISTSICKLKSLPKLDLRDCYQLETFPEIWETMESLKSLHLNRSAIKVLHTSVEHLNGLQELDLYKCGNLEMLPSSICNLTSLEYLRLYNCINLEMLPSSICNLTSLKSLNLCNCSKLNKLPDNLGNLKSLKNLEVSGSGVGQLPSSITCLENIEFLRSNNCSLMKILEDIGYLSSLKELELRGNMFESLPKSIKQLSNLEFLLLRDCNMLRSLPEIPEGLELLDAKDCDQLCQVPDASEFVRCINSKSHDSTYDHCVNFIFINCLNLKAVSNVFDESLRIMQRTEKGSGKPSNQFSIYLPGNKILEWFSYQSLESSVNIQVLWNDLVNRKFMGFAICAVLGFDEYSSRCDMLGVYCNFEAYHDRMKICNGGRYYPTQHQQDLHRVFMDSEHMLLGYCSFSSFYSKFQNPEKLHVSDSDYVDISIEFKSHYNGCNQLKCCAVHPIYVEEPIEIIGTTIQDIRETSGKRSDRSDDNNEDVEPHPKRICTQAIKTP